MIILSSLRQLPCHGIMNNQEYQSGFNALKTEYSCHPLSLVMCTTPILLNPIWPGGGGEGGHICQPRSSDKASFKMQEELLIGSRCRCSGSSSR